MRPSSAAVWRRGERSDSSAGGRQPGAHQPPTAVSDQTLVRLTETRPPTPLPAPLDGIADTELDPFEP